MTHSDRPSRVTRRASQWAKAADNRSFSRWDDGRTAPCRFSCECEACRPGWTAAAASRRGGGSTGKQKDGQWWGFSSVLFALQWGPTNQICVETQGRRNTLYLFYLLFCQGVVKEMHNLTSRTNTPQSLSFFCWGIPWGINHSQHYKLQLLGWTVCIYFSFIYMHATL